MNTVDSWIDSEHIANLMERLSSAPGSEVEKRGDGPVLSPARTGGVAPSKAARLAAEADAATQLSPEDDVISFPALGAPSSRAAEAVGTRRDRVRRRLAEVKAQAAESGLLNARPGGGAQAAAFTSAVEEIPVASPEQRGESRAAIERDEALEERLAAFGEKVKKRFGCVRVLVSDSNGASLLPEGVNEPALLAAMQKLSESWMGCQRELRLKDPGVLSTVLGKGYRMVVISCETEKGLVSLGLVTRDLVSDSEMVRLRAALRGVLEG